MRLKLGERKWKKWLENTSKEYQTCSNQKEAKFVKRNEEIACNIFAWCKKIRIIVCVRWNQEEGSHPKLFDHFSAL